MYEFHRLTKIVDLNNLRLFQSFTTSPFNTMLGDPEKLDNLIAIGVTHKSIPVGLGILQKKPEIFSAQFVSLFIKKEHRHQHLGTRTLKMLEEELLKEPINYRQITSVYPISAPTAPFFEKILLNQQWEVNESIFGGKIPNNVKFPWITKKLRIHSDFEIFKWKDLSANERQYIIDKQQRGWFTAEFNPFDKELDVEYLNSLGLKHKGDIIGWQITHRIQPDVIQYWCLFIDPSVQKTGIGMQLLAEAIRIQVEAYPPLIYGCFFFRQGRVNTLPQWENFFQKKLAPYCTSITHAHESIKILRRE